ncbi:hypothetical protein [Streptomyces sp. NPDC058954]|uniref:hypothetical protein n=1 Tax=Streptomyces sp. NPDC058954 TaxID=3346677 RepID=UPI00368C63FC
MTVNPDLAKAHRAVSDARLARDWSRAGLAMYDKRIQSGETGLDAEHLAQGQQAATDETSYQAAREAYTELAQEEPQLWPHESASDPLLLLPLRLETVYHHAGEAALELWIRAYPDEIHVDSHEPALTPAERVAAEAYWREVWAAGPNQPRRKAAWSRLVTTIGPGRAAWAVQALRPGLQQPPSTETPAGGDPPSPEPWSVQPAQRDGAWTRPSRSSVLPDRLVFSGYEIVGDGQIGLVWRQEGAPIPEALDVGPGPDSPVPPAWLCDFEEAVRVGMGVKVPVEDGMRTDFPLVTVTGVRGGTSEQTSALIGSLLDAHRCTDGLSVLPNGTPTNNTEATRSAWRTRMPPPSPEQADSQRAAFVPGSAQAAARVARALGPTAGRVLAQTTEGLCDDDHDLLLQLHAAIGAMAASSTNWMNYDGDSQVDLVFLVSHFVEYVRARGPLPTLRVGRQPYGILPVTSIDLWHGTEVDLRILDHIQGFRTFAESQGWRCPRVGGGGDSDQVINDILHRLPASRRLRFVQQEPVTPPFQPAPDNPIGGIPYLSGFAWQQPPDPEALPLPLEFAVAVETTPELQEVLKSRPLRTLCDLWGEEARLTSLHQEIPPELGERMRELAPALDNVGTGRIGLWYHLAMMVLWLYRFRLEERFDSDGAVDPLVALTDGKVTAQPGTVPQFYDWAAMAFRQLAATEDMAGTDLPRLERLLCEVLDTQTHRLDAWMTSVATARLTRLRADRPDGTHLGAYGWVTDLQPRDPEQQPVPTDPEDATEDGANAPPEDSGHPRDGREPRDDGYLVAPSMHHATTAAVLRSGWLSHAHAEAFGIDLRASRVRRALTLVDGVRSGQSLGALLGYRLERGLHDAQLDQLIALFRAAYPNAHVVDPEASHSQEAVTAMAARDVVDGQALLADWTAHGGRLQDLDSLTSQLTDATRPLLDRASPLVADLEDAVDAVGDLLLAESVHHLVAGNPMRSGSAADGISRGENLPQDFEVVRTPQAAVALSHRLGLLAPTTGTGGWHTDRPLAALEPALERWCEHRLGDASGWSFGFGDPAAPTTVGLADLGLCALDVVLDAGPAERDRTGAATPEAYGTLMQRLLRQAPAGTSVTDSGAARFAELRLLSRGLADVLRAGRPLLVTDLDADAGDDWGNADLAELAARVTAWHGTVASALAGLREEIKSLPGTAQQVAQELDTLADCGLPNAAPPAALSADDRTEALRAHAAAVLDRFEATPLPDLPGPPPEDPSAVLEWVTALRTAVSSVVGGSLPLLPMLRLAATAAGAALSGPPQGAEEDTVADWLLEMERVRPRARTFGDALTAAEVLAGTTACAATVAQLPAGQQWIARGPAPLPSRTRPAPRHCAVLRTEGPADPGQVAGLVVDAWTESVPEPAAAASADGQGPQAGHEAREEMGGLAFHYDQPDARAPQALLLALPPDRGRGWRMEDIHAVVEETFALAQIRGMDLNDFAELRGLLPVQWTMPPHGSGLL